MLTKLDSHEQLSEQDYGPWLDRVTLYEKNGKFFLQEQFGYDKPYDENWYELAAKPDKPLAALVGAGNGGWCGGGVLEDFFGDNTLTPT